MFLQMIYLPVEVILCILENLSRGNISSLSRVNKFLYEICSRVIYSEVVITEKYDRSRFRVTRKFIRTISSSVPMSYMVRSLVIKWNYPPRVDMGFDSIVTSLRQALINMKSLRKLVLIVRLRDKSFNECFSENCSFRLERFECNFGKEKDKYEFLKKHRM